MTFTCAISVERGYGRKQLNIMTRLLQPSGVSGWRMPK
jgi:hypothetical protein